MNGWDVLAKVSAGSLLFLSTAVFYAQFGLRHMGSGRIGSELAKLPLGTSVVLFVLGIALWTGFSLLAVNAEESAETEATSER